MTTVSRYGSRVGLIVGMLSRTEQNTFQRTIVEHGEQTTCLHVVLHYWKNCMYMYDRESWPTTDVAVGPAP